MLIFKIHFHHINLFEHVILINYNRFFFFIDKVKRKHVIVTALDTSKSRCVLCQMSVCVC